MSPCQVKTNDKGVELLEGLQSPLYSNLKLFGEKLPIQLQPPAVDCFGHCLILSSVVTFRKRFLMALPWKLYYCLYKMRTLFVFKKLRVSYMSKMSTFKYHFKV